MIGCLSCSALYELFDKRKRMQLMIIRCNSRKKTDAHMLGCLSCSVLYELFDKRKRMRWWGTIFEGSFRYNIKRE